MLVKEIAFLEDPNEKTEEVVEEENVEDETWGTEHTTVIPED